TNQDLDALVAQGKFRQDFYYRINPATVVVPPLRERMEDLPDLTDHFVGAAARRERKTPPSLSAEALRILKAHSWPGNVRELENVLARAVILCDGPEIADEHL